MLASSPTSHGITIEDPTLSARGRTRFSSASPWNVKASSAPAFAAAEAMPHPMERSLATPMIKPRLPSRIFDEFVMTHLQVTEIEDISKIDLINLHMDKGHRKGGL